MGPTRTLIHGEKPLLVNFLCVFLAKIFVRRVYGCYQKGSPSAKGVPCLSPPEIQTKPRLGKSKFKPGSLESTYNSHIFLKCYNLIPINSLHKYKMY